MEACFSKQITSTWPSKHEGQIKMSLKSQLLMLKRCFFWGQVKTTKCDWGTRTTWAWGAMMLTEEVPTTNYKQLSTWLSVKPRWATFCPSLTGLLWFSCKNPPCDFRFLLLFWYCMCVRLLYVFISSLLFLMAPFMFYHITPILKKTNPKQYEQNCFDMTLIVLI